MATIERPRFEDCTGYNDCDDGIYADALDEYCTRLDEYVDMLEDRCKTIDLSNKILKARNKELDNYRRDVELALKMAIDDAAPYVGKWEMIAEKRGEQLTFEYCVGVNKLYLHSVYGFYYLIARKQRLEERLDIELESKAQAAETIEIKTVNGETVQFGDIPPIKMR
jgi:hypothetical protein